jgi:hypothetical protein
MHKILQSWQTYFISMLKFLYSGFSRQKDGAAQRLPKPRAADHYRPLLAEDFERTTGHRFRRGQPAAEAIGPAHGAADVGHGAQGRLRSQGLGDLPNIQHTATDEPAAGL